MTVMGRKCRNICKNLPMSDAERKDPAAIIMKLEGHFQPKRNAIYERHVFQCRIQGPDEEFDRFVDDLRQLSASSAYGELEDEMLRDRIVFGIKDGAPRSRLLWEPDLTLDKAIDMVRSDEVSSKRLQRMEGETVNYLQTRRKSAPPVATVVAIIRKETRLWTDMQKNVKNCITLLRSADQTVRTP